MGKDVLAAVLASLIVLPFSAFAQTDATPQKPNVATIQVTGSGSVDAKPDIAVINIGVNSEDANPQNALSRNNAATAKVISELEGAGVEKKDLQTSNFSIYPQYRTEGENKHQVVTYRVSNTVTVKIRNVEHVGEILGKAVSAGSNQISGPAFTVDSPQKYLTEARKKAVEDAKEKAGVYAAAAGMSLGAVLSINDETSAPVYPAARPAGFARTAAAAPVEAGSESIQARVVIVYELKHGS